MIGTFNLMAGLRTHSVQMRSYNGASVILQQSKSLHLAHTRKFM